jgi:hypothetical protein
MSLDRKTFSMLYELARQTKSALMVTLRVSVANSETISHLPTGFSGTEFT